MATLRFKALEQVFSRKPVIAEAPAKKHQSILA